MKLVIPKWILVQVGIAKTPQYNVITDLSYTPVDSSIQTHSGATYDSMRDRVVQFPNGIFRHTGSYVSAWTPAPESWSYTELDWIQSYKNTRVPILFCRLDSTVTPTGRELVRTPQGVLYAWAVGRVTKVDDNYSSEMAQIPDMQNITIEGRLDTALRKITYATWRYGRDIVSPLGLRNALTTPEREFTYAESKEQWFVPSHIPNPQSENRFWPRDLTPGLDMMDAANWDSDTRVLFDSPSVHVIIVDGNTMPRMQISMSGDTVITVTNKRGVKRYSYDQPSASVLYFDSDTPSVIRRMVYGSEEYIAVQEMPFLGHYENKIFVEQGRCVFGVTPQWVN